MSIELLQPVEVVRDQEGYWIHPGYDAVLAPYLEHPESEAVLCQKWEEFLREQQLESVTIEMEFDAPEELRERYFHNDETDCVSEWQPTKPEGDGWFMLSLFDTEDGPMCTWARRVPAAQQQEAAHV